MLNYEIDPAVLRPLVPRGTALDLWQDRCFVSIVGFLFLDTRVLGVPVPLHQDFPEVNLRFYVRRETGGEVRRGVVFLRELVPRLAVALLARTIYNEPYRAVPMRYTVPGEIDAGGTVRYEWRRDGTWETLETVTSAPARLADSDSHETFITEHFWGYTARQGRPTLEYRVEHPRWRVRDTSSAALTANVAALYGLQFAAPLASAPYSAFVATGSAVSVYPAVSLPGT